MYVLSWFVHAFFIECLCGILVAISGRLAPAILFHGLIRAISMYLMDDQMSADLALRVFISSSWKFYTLQALLPALPACALAFMLRNQKHTHAH